MAPILQPGKQGFHYFDLLCKSIEFGELAIRELPPPSFGTCASFEPEEQCTDLIQGETRLSRSLDHGQTIEYCPVIAPLSADSFRSRKQA